MVGRYRHIHPTGLFAPLLSDHPQEVVMIASEEETELIFDHLQKEGVHLFYVKTPVEFGVLDSRIAKKIECSLLGQSRY